MREKFEWTGILGLIGSAIGGVACVVSFTFLTFQTKSEAQIESDHTETQQNNIKDDIHAIRSSLDHLQDKVDLLLEHINDHH